MTQKFREPQFVGGELEYFAEQRLLRLIAPKICGKREEPSGCCDNCYGMVILGHIENQIGKAGISFMKQLVKDWAKDST